MPRLAYALLFAAACSMGTDNRPKTAEYATEAILAPNCSGAACHSAFAGNDGIAFDTLDGARHALVNLVSLESVKNDRTDPDVADLIIWTSQLDPKGLGIGRMPYDRPIAQADEDYLKAFIVAGMPDAACNPGLARVCDAERITTCESSWNFGTTLGVCGQLSGTTTDCSSGVCTCDLSHGDCNNEMIPDGCETFLGIDGNCGGCGTKCDTTMPTTAVCRENLMAGKPLGTYSCQCALGQAVCAGACTPINANPNCGGCGVTCSGAKTCKPTSTAGGFACQ